MLVVNDAAEIVVEVTDYCRDDEAPRLLWTFSYSLP